MERLTTNEDTTSNYLTMMNYAYSEKGKVHLKYGDGESDIDLCEYISRMAKCKNCCPTAEEVMKGMCIECDCEFAILYITAVQAAELRERLIKYEDTGLEPEQIVHIAKENSELKRLLRMAVDDLAWSNCNMGDNDECPDCPYYSGKPGRCLNEWKHAKEAEAILKK